jgi:hypothetical protein
MESTGSKLEIQYYRRERFGTEDWWPVSPDAMLVCELVGTKTLTDSTISILDDSGATFQEVMPPR